ncbi:MAG TPA: J domain-containing protein [Thermoanaerobaculia bacterium]|nr:J domain-containing protein [Thermoanaerobaculia bacterium]
MRIEDCYRILELRPGASEQEVTRAWRELIKVWHPDRFANDPLMRKRAEEKVKALNEAYETIRGTRVEKETPRRPSTAWPVACVIAALIVLARRPTPGGLIIAAVLCGIAVVLFVKSR